MKELALKVIDLLDRKEVDYADVRVVRLREEGLQVKNGVLEAWSDGESEGFGLRVLVDGYWGFAAAADLSGSETERVVREALALARASARVGGERVRLAPVHAHEGEWRGPCLEDPFKMGAEEKIEFLLHATRDLAAPGIAFAQGQLGSFREDKVFASTDGVLVEQQRTEAGAAISAVSIRDGDVQVRSYPSAHGGSWNQGGFEVVRGLELAREAPRVAEQALALLDATPCPADVTTLILDADQMALQVHESVGHPTELDRMLGSEWSYAGGSFVSGEDVGELRYGSEAVTILADATTPGGLGTFGWDDEGVRAQRHPLVRRGLLVGLQTSRETAGRVGLTPSGGMRASSWSRIPLVRMTNINLEPGEWDLEDLIADTKEGLLLATNKSWSIDDRRLNFHFGTEIGWEIRNGRRGKMLRDCTYSGTTPPFWRSCDAVCNRDHWVLFGLTNCGKGEPGQTAHVGHGAAPARFRDVRVEAAR